MTLPQEDLTGPLTQDKLQERLVGEAEELGLEVRYEAGHKNPNGYFVTGTATVVQPPHHRTVYYNAHKAAYSDRGLGYLPYYLPMATIAYVFNLVPSTSLARDDKGRQVPGLSSTLAHVRFLTECRDEPTPRCKCGDGYLDSFHGPVKVDFSPNHTCLGSTPDLSRVKKGVNFIADSIADYWARGYNKDYNLYFWKQIPFHRLLLHRSGRSWRSSRTVFDAWQSMSIEDIEDIVDTVAHAKHWQEEFPPIVW